MSLHCRICGAPADTHGAMCGDPMEDHVPVLPAEVLPVEQETEEWFIPIRVHGTYVRCGPVYKTTDGATAWLMGSYGEGPSLENAHILRVRLPKQKGATK